VRAPNNGNTGETNITSLLRWNVNGVFMKKNIIAISQIHQAMLDRAHVLVGVDNAEVDQIATEKEGATCSRAQYSKMRSGDVNMFSSAAEDRMQKVRLVVALSA